MKHEYDFPMPAVTADAILFAMVDGRVSVLLVQRGKEPYKGSWATPGGHLDVDADPDLETTAYRELKEETGIDAKGVVELRQLHTFSKKGRDPRGRYIGVVFYGVVDPHRFQIQAGDDADNAKWFPLDSLPPLAFDHHEAIQMGAKKVQEEFV